MRVLRRGVVRAGIPIRTFKGPEYIPSYDEPSVKGWLNLWDIDGERRWAVVGTSPGPAPASVEVFYCPWCGRELD